MNTDREKSKSDSTLLNNNSLHHGYGSLGIFHTPPIPGAESHTTPHTHSPPSLNDEFLFSCRQSSSPHLQDSILPFSTIQSPMNTQNISNGQSFTRNQMAIAMTPQQSAISSSSSYSESNLSNTDYLKYNTIIKENLNRDTIQHPYFNSINNPLFNEVIDVTPHSLNEIQPNYLDHHYSTALSRMSSNQNIAGKSNNTCSLLIFSPTKNANKSKSNLCNNLLPMLYTVNATLGLAFLSQPWAIAHGGWTAIIGFIIVVLISHHCCSIYVKVFSRHTESFTYPSYPSYPQLGWIISGSWAYYLILIFSVCECVGIACVYIMFLWNNVYYLLCRFETYTTSTSTDSTIWSDWSMWDISEKNELLVLVLCIITILPSILILRISNMYYLSYTILIGLVIMGISLLIFIMLHVVSHQELAHYDLEHPLNGAWKYWISTYSEFSISIGIFLFCFTSNSYSKLPLIQTSMKKPQLFENVLRHSYLLLFVMYVLIGICGYLLYGKTVHSIILRNIMHHCQTIGSVCDLICIFFVIATWSAISPLCAKISDFIESNIIYEWLRNRKKQQSASQIAQNYSIRTIQRYLQEKQEKNTMHHNQCNMQKMDSINSIDSTNSISSARFSQRLAPLEIPTDNQEENQEENQDEEGVIKRNTITTYVTSERSTYANPSSFDDTTVYITDTTKRICRTLVFLLLLLISWMFRDNIAFLESIVGICFSTVTCMILPCLLYLKSFWNALSCWNKLAHILLTVFVIISTIALLIGSIVDVITGQDCCQ